MRNAHSVFSVLGLTLAIACVACGSNEPSPPPDARKVYSVQLAVLTTADLPACTAAGAGTTAHVESPPSLRTCQTN